MIVIYNFSQKNPYRLLNLPHSIKYLILLTMKNIIQLTEIWENFHLYALRNNYNVGYILNLKRLCKNSKYIQSMTHGVFIMTAMNNAWEFSGHLVKTSGTMAKWQSF